MYEYWVPGNHTARTLKLFTNVKGHHVYRYTIVVKLIQSRIKHNKNTKSYGMYRHNCFNLKTTCFFFFRSKRLTIMLALQVLQSDDRMNPHQDHTTNTAMKKWSESLKWTSEKVNKQKLLGAMAIFKFCCRSSLSFSVVVFSH